MVECSGADHWMDDDVFVDSKRKDRPKKTRKEIGKINCVDQDNKSKALERLYELPIPKSDQSLLVKLISNGYLVSVDKILFRKNNSLILSGKANRKHRIFPLLSTDDVVIKIPINGTKEELWQRSNTERHQNKSNETGDNQPTFLLQTGHILVTSMIGNDGVPAPTLTDILRSNQRNIVTVYDEIIQFWCKLKNRPFHASNYLYHNGRWWRVGYGGPHAYDVSTDESTNGLAFYRANLKHIIDLFCQHGLNMKQAEDGFMKHAGNHYWDTIQAMRGMTQKRSFFSIMYMEQNSDK